MLNDDAELMLKGGLRKRYDLYLFCALVDIWLEDVELQYTNDRIDTEALKNIRVTDGLNI